MAVYHCAFPLPLPTMYSEIVESTSVSSVSGKISKLSRKGLIASKKAANGPMTLLEQILMGSMIISHRTASFLVCLPLIIK